MHYWGFSEPQALVGVFRTPDINGGFQNPMHYWGFSEPRALMGVFETPGINGVFETPGKLRYFQGLLKTPVIR